MQEPKTGRYAGIGSGGMQVGFDVTKPDFNEVEEPSFSLVFDGCSAGLSLFDSST